jgi:hypothetical protein
MKSWPEYGRVAFHRKGAWHPRRSASESCRNNTSQNEVVPHCTPAATHRHLLEVPRVSYRGACGMPRYRTGPAWCDGSVQRCPWPGLSTTGHADGADATFEVVHPHHPLNGQHFKLVTHRHNWGEDRVYFHDSSGVLRSIPACWTTVLSADPFVALAAGRCLFRYDC